MTLVAGASQFLNTAVLNNQSGGGQFTGQTANSILGGFDNNISVLEIGKQNAAPGIGLSASARAQTQAFLAQSQSVGNQLLSAGAQSTIDGAQTQILAIQSRLPASSIGSFSARFEAPESDNNPFNTLGRNVDVNA